MMHVLTAIIVSIDILYFLIFTMLLLQLYLDSYHRNPIIHALAASIFDKMLTDNILQFTWLGLLIVPILYFYQVIPAWFMLGVGISLVLRFGSHLYKKYYFDIRKLYD